MGRCSCSRTSTRSTRAWSGCWPRRGALDQIGRVHGRAWGEIDDPAVRARVEAHLRAGAAVNSLRGTTFGRIGGRPMGMYTAVSNTDDWMRRFGVDVEEIDQWELVRRSERVDRDARRERVASGSSATRPASTTTTNG